MQHNNKYLKLMVLFCLATFMLPTYARDLILTAPPRETKEEAAKLYGPIADHLTKLLGVKVVYQSPGNWLNYQREMRNDVYDIVFDGPHFVSWRIARLGHDVLVKLPGTLEFYLVKNKGNNTVSVVEDLVGRKFCGIAPPNLSTLTVLDRFRNPVRQPVIKPIRGGMPKVFKALKDEQCEAAVLRTTFFKKKLKQPERDQLEILFHSSPLPNQAISVSRRVSPRAKAKILDSLTMGSGVESTRGLVTRFGGKKAKSFIPAKNDEYQGHNLLLEGVIFGW